MNNTATIYPQVQMQQQMNQMMQQIMPGMPSPAPQVMVDEGQLRPILIPDDKSAPKLRYVAYATKKPLSCYFYCCSCCPCIKVADREFRKSTYVKVYESHLEYNEPTVDWWCIPGGERSKYLCDCACIDCRCCNFCNGTVSVTDDVRIIYFDRSIAQNAEKAACCAPSCTHCSLCPTCFDICGESVVLYPNSRSCCKVSLCATRPCGVCCKWEPVSQGVNTATATSMIQSLCSLRSIFLGICCKPYRILGFVDDANALANQINAAREAARAKFGPVIPGLTREEAERQS